MRSSLFVALVTAVALFVLLCSASVAKAESLLMFSDTAYTDSTLHDSGPGTVDLYIVHADIPGGTGIRFSTEASAGFTGVWLGDTSAFMTVGNSTTDLSVGYGLCVVGSVLVVTVSYQFFGTSSACSELSIAPASGFPCVFAASGGGCIEEQCLRNLGRINVNCPVATEPTTWGRVKALYRG